MTNRYCGNCGQELRPEDQFCPNCGRAVHETVHAPTPEADVTVPPPPPQQTAETAQPTQQAGAPPQRRGVIAGRLFIGCIVVVFALFALFVVTSIVGGGSGESGDSGVSNEKEQPTIACEVGDPCDLGESTLTVTKADATDLIATSLGNSEGNFVLIEFDYTYGGTQPATVEDYYWKLEDGKGRTYNYAFDPTSNYEIDKGRSLIYEEINPGTKRDGAIVFEVAPDAQDFILYVKDLIRPQTSKRAEVYL